MKLFRKARVWAVLIILAIPGVALAGLAIALAGTGLLLLFFGYVVGVLAGAFFSVINSL